MPILDEHPPRPALTVFALAERFVTELHKLTADDAATIVEFLDRELERYRTVATSAPTSDPEPAPTLTEVVADMTSNIDTMVRCVHAASPNVVPAADAERAAADLETAVDLLATWAPRLPAYNKVLRDRLGTLRKLA